MLNLNTTSFEDILGRLKAYEEEETEEDQRKQMYANTERQVNQSYQTAPNKIKEAVYHQKVRQITFSVSQGNKWRAPHSCFVCR